MALRFPLSRSSLSLTVRWWMSATRDTGNAPRKPASGTNFIRMWEQLEFLFLFLEMKLYSEAEYPFPLDKRFMILVEYWNRSLRSSANSLSRNPSESSRFNKNVHAWLAFMLHHAVLRSSCTLEAITAYISYTIRSVRWLMLRRLKSVHFSRTAAMSNLTSCKSITI